MSFLVYLYTTLSREVRENIAITRAIISFHWDEHKLTRSESTKYEYLKCQLLESSSYSEWSERGTELDKLTPVSEWKRTITSKHYDFEYILSLKSKLCTARLMIDENSTNEEYVFELMDLIR